MSHRLYTLVKKRGFKEVLTILSTFENSEAPQKLFLNRFQTEGDSYYNAFLRIRTELVNTGIIAFKINDRQEKVIYLTEKGKKVWEKIQELEDKLKL